MSNYFVKESYERFNIIADFSKVLDVGELVSLLDSSLEVLDKNGLPAEDVYDSGTFALKAGSDGLMVQCKDGDLAHSPYLFTFRAQTDASPPNRWELKVSMYVDYIPRDTQPL